MTGSDFATALLYAFPIGVGAGALFLAAYYLTPKLSRLLDVLFPDPVADTETVRRIESQRQRDQAAKASRRMAASPANQPVVPYVRPDVDPITGRWEFPGGESA